MKTVPESTSIAESPKVPPFISGMALLGACGGSQAPHAYVSNSSKTPQIGGAPDDFDDTTDAGFDNEKLVIVDNED
jgi:hypothetical protein